MTDLDPAAWGLPPGLHARLALAPDAPDAERVLSDDERRRLGSFGHPARRRQFALGRLAARTLAADHLGHDPRRVPLVVAPDGAPELVGRAVSIAHTARGGDVAALAALAPVAVGVDVERVRPRRPDLWRRILDPAEFELLDALGGPTDATQTLLWTLKEAVLKAQRTGFRAGGRSVRLSLDGPGRVRALSGGRAWALAHGTAEGVQVAIAWPAP